MTKLLRRAEVLERVGASYTSIWQWMRDGKFPRAIRLSEEGQAVRWRESEIEKWIESRPRQRLKGDRKKKPAKR